MTRSTLMRHEWRALRADPALLVVVALFAACLIYGVATGTRWQHFQREAIAAAESEERERYQQITRLAADADARRVEVSPFADPRNPEALGRRLGTRHAILPSPPLAPLAIGQSDVLPAYYRISTDAKELLLAATEIENPLRLLIGRFDLAFVILYLYPLLILALAYNLLSSEKEQGTLALMLSQPVSLSSLIAAKINVRAALFLAVLVLVGGTSLVLGGVMPQSAATWLRVGAWLAIVAAYGAIWFSLAVFAASFGRGSATNAMTLAAVWLLLVVVLPSCFNLVATTLYPVPSRVEMIQAMREATDQANAEGSKLLARFYEDHPELSADSPERAMNDFNVIRLAVADRTEARVRPVLDTFERQLARQQEVAGGLRWLSPAILAQEAMNDLAGTGVERHRNFVAQVDRFHQAWRGFFAPRIVQRAQVRDFDAVPAFTFVEEPDSHVRVRVGARFLGLALPALLIGATGVRRLARYPVAG